MFFILSKIVDFLFSPLNWCIFLFGISLCVKNEGLKKRFKYFSFGLLLFFSIPFILQLALNIFSLIKVPKANKHEIYEAGIVMGGMLSFNDSNNHLVFNSNCNRLTSAIELYKNGVIKKKNGGCSHHPVRPLMFWYQHLLKKCEFLPILSNWLKPYSQAV